MIWGFLPLSLIAIAIAVGCALSVRHEGRTGKAYILFWPMEHWSRDRRPVAFQIRQIMGWSVVALFGLCALAFFMQFLGFARA